MIILVVTTVSVDFMQALFFPVLTVIKVSNL